MNNYFKINTLNSIVELFGLIFFKDYNSPKHINYTYLENFLASIVSQRQKYSLIDYYKELIGDFQTYNDEKIHKSILEKLETINKNLNSYYKYQLYLMISERLISIGNKNNHVSKYCNKNFLLVKENLQINKQDIENINHFLNEDYELLSHTQSPIVVGDFSNYKLSNFKMFQINDFKGKLFVFYLKSVHFFIFKYNGNDKLLLNKQLIFSKVTYLLSIGGLIENSAYQTVFFGDLYRKTQSKFTERTTFKAVNIQKIFPGTGQGIKRVSFELESGQMAAILGGSGSGKTTLFNILCGVSKPDMGQISINNIVITDSFKFNKSLVGYVPQEDSLIEELTVYQNLKYCAELNRSELNKQELKQLLSETLHNFGLEDIKNLKVGSIIAKVISGGQRKRLNIAIEIIRNPKILFVDEPTSGLSSSDALLITKLLKKISENGSIVVINIHQPSSDVFRLFDRLLIIDTGGFPIYFGNPFLASSYFKKQLNIADSIEEDFYKYNQYNPKYIFDLITYSKKDEVGNSMQEREISNKEWHRQYKKNYRADLLLEENTIFKSKISNKTANFVKQFSVFFKRSILSKVSDSQYLIFLLLGSPLLSLITNFFIRSTKLEEKDYSFYNNENIPVFIFINVIIALFFGLITSANEIHRDKKLLKREQLLQLNRYAYLNSKIVIVSIITFIQVSTLVLVGNYIQEVKGLTFQYIVILWITAISAAMIGLVISAKLNSTLSIYISIPFILIPQILLAGAILDFDKINSTLTSKKNVPFYSNLIISRWSYEALTTLQYGNNRYNKEIINASIDRSSIIYMYNFFIPAIETELYNYLDHNTSINSKRIFSLFEQTKKISTLTYNFIFPDTINQSIAEQKLVEINNIKIILRNKMKIANKKIDDIIKNKLDCFNKTEYCNAKLSDIVLKSNEYVNYIYINDHLIRKFQPGLYISDSKFGNSHLYAPYKRIGNYNCTTWVYNMFFLIFISVVIYFYIATYLKRKYFNSK